MMANLTRDHEEEPQTTNKQRTQSQQRANTHCRTANSRGVATMLVLILLQSLVLIVEGGKLQHIQNNQRRRLQLNHEDIVENHVATNDQLTPKFFQNMVNTNYELTAVESHQKMSEFQPVTIEYSQSANVGEMRQQKDFTFVNDESTFSPLTSEKKNLLNSQERIVLVPEDLTKKSVLVIVPNWKRPDKSHLNHHRQKRFTKSKMRVIAVPLSVFNFLGFLPVRVPGLPYHEDLPPPDYTHYNTMYEIPISRKRYKYF